MSVNYTAYQFDTAFQPTKLGNWEVSRKTIKRPTLPKGTTKIICDENGRFLSDNLRPKTSPWSSYRNTWQLPERISRHQASELNETFRRRKKTANDSPQAKSDQKQEPNPPATNQELNQLYVPGDFTSPEQQHPSRSELLQEALNPDEESKELELNELYTEKHQCTDRISLIEKREKLRRKKIPHILGEEVEDNFENMKIRTQIPDKPTERSPSPLIPAYSNFQMARKMAQENLEHQPLPDCIMDRAFRKLQAQGEQYPGLALGVIPAASGVGIKTYKAGPTHCTKMKIFRPKTCGVVPKPVGDYQPYRPQSSFPGKDKVSSMDLAICWDYRPADPLDEPQPPKHIDGSNGSAAPAVFTLVKTPRTPEKLDTGRSAGIFTNTFRDEGFFDKDILRRKTNFGEQRVKTALKCSCGTSPINFASARISRSQSASRHDLIGDRSKRCKSSPNLSQIVNVSETSYFLRNRMPPTNENLPRKKEHTCGKYRSKNKDEKKTKRNTRLCEQQEAQLQVSPNIVAKEVYKQAFKAGVPKSNSAGTVSSFDSGCSTMSSGTCSTTKVVYVPKPRHPYAKRNYNIDTLVPPFACIKGGAGQGGYPEHWRLASVYQHAYKPMEQRKRPLLQTVYK